MNGASLKELIRRYQAGSCTAEEKAMLELWFEVTSQKGKFQWSSTEEKYQERIKILKGIQQAQHPIRVRRWSLRPFIGLAAAMMLISCMVGWYFFIHLADTNQRHTAYKQKAVRPGSNQAMLTLSDGSSLLVDTKAAGRLAKDGGTEVVKNKSGEIEYHLSERNTEHQGRNTLSVPRGGTFQVSLPDGSKVWLNSATTMKYFAGNAGKERRIELSGEAYFEVFHDPTRPFLVICNDAEIKVTGTHFNVSAYEDETLTRTTLAEGQVIVSKNKQQSKLSPGQQAITNGDQPIVVSVADVENALAWREGYFVFDDQDLASVLKMIARWYDVEIKYTGTLPTKRFGGTFSKDKGLEGLLDYLELLGDIRIVKKGKTITVMN